MPTPRHRFVSTALACAAVVAIAIGAAGVTAAGADSALCPPGTWSTDGTVAAGCTLAVPGTFVPTEGATSATLAPPGYFVDTFGAVAATPAPLGYYVDVVGAAAAIACPPGTTTLYVASASAADCVSTGPSYSVSGFSDPVDMGGVVNVVKAGATVPLKFEVFDGAAEVTDVAVVQSFSWVRVSCESGVPSDTIDEVTAGSTTLRYDATTGQFVQNWKTPKYLAGACITVTLTIVDGSSIAAEFQLR